ncbi:tail assembly chaperone [Enterococcus faecalis]
MIKINGKEYNLFFGMRFLEAIEANNQGELTETLGYLLTTAIYDRNLLSIAKLVKAGICTNEEVLSADVDNYLEKEATDKELDKLVSFLKSTAKACNATKKIMKQAEEMAKANGFT